MQIILKKSYRGPASVDNVCNDLYLQLNDSLKVIRLMVIYACLTQKK